VIAIGIDAAEPSLVRTLAARGDMPALQELIRRGTSGRVVSPAVIGSVAAWPTFLTATSLWEHEKHSFWSWDPRRMRVARETFGSLRPFWRAPELAERTVGVLDVPFAPSPARLRGFEIADWGPHDFLFGTMRAYPSALASRIRAVVGRPPIDGPLEAETWAWVPADLAERSTASVARRGRLIEYLLREEAPELFIAVFTEAHRASHMLWHTASGVCGRPGAPPRPDRPGLIDIFREIDRQIGRILTLAGDEAAVLVFSLHGIRASRGVPRVLDPLLRAVGLATALPEPVLSSLRHRTPTPIKRLYQRFMPIALRQDLARFGLMTRYDWSRTRVFPLPSEQHGWLRVNLKGREAAGIVEPSDYERLCGEVARLLCDLRTEEDHPVVNDVVRTSPNYSTGVSGHVPDLIVHWAPAATSGSFRLRSPALRCELGARRLTGEHAPDGLWIFRSPRAGGPATDAAIPAEALGRLLTDQLAAS
jgi:predicted AlkP superfamily phosphohydrolase/phosphomutase